MSTTIHEEEVLIEIIEEYSVATVEAMNVGDVDVLIGVASTFAEAEGGETDLVEISTGEQGPPGDPGPPGPTGTAVQPTEPSHDVVWVDTDEDYIFGPPWVELTQAAYDALTPDPNTLYVVIG